MTQPMGDIGEAVNGEIPGNHPDTDVFSDPEDSEDAIQALEKVAYYMYMPGSILIAGIKAHRKSGDYASIPGMVKYYGAILGLETAKLLSLTLICLEARKSLKPILDPIIQYIQQNT